MPLVLDGKAAAARIKDKLSARVQQLYGFHSAASPA